MKQNISRKLPLYIYKRNNSIAPFSLSKIEKALEKARVVTQEFGTFQVPILSSYILQNLQAKKKISVEEIQDLVEEALWEKGFFKTARCYIRYREQHKTLRQDKYTLLEVESSMNEYLEKSDWRVNANANQGYSLGGLILNVSGKVTANYWLNHIYPPEIGNAHRHADFHIHDLDMLSGYCAGWSLRTLLQEGFNGVPGKIEASAPKHFSSALGQMVNFLGTLQNEWAGAQAFSSFDTYLAPYIRLDQLEYSAIKQHMQEFIYNLNIPSRWGTQTPFTNLTLDWTCPDDLKKQNPIIAGKEQTFTYDELHKEMAQINLAFIEVMMQGDDKGRAFTFPIPTYNITSDFNWEHQNVKPLFEMTAKYGTPYFQNFLRGDLKPSMVRSMCCRLQLDLRELLKRGNGLFGSAEQTGSIGVVTINCARLGYLYNQNKKALYQRTDELLILAQKSLEIKRKAIARYMEGGLFPFTKRYLGSFRNHFSTIGVNGLHEMVRNFTKDQENLSTSKGISFIEEYLNHIRQKMKQFQEETGHLYNLEATPGEGTTYRFAKEDQKRCPAILQAGTKEHPYYTNSSQLPANYTDDPFEALELQNSLQTKYTGGTVLHLYMQEAISDWDNCKKLVFKSLNNFDLPYITISPTFSICPQHGYLSGHHPYCPKCDEKLLEETAQTTKEEYYETIK